MTGRHRHPLTTRISSVIALFLALGAVVAFLLVRPAPPAPLPGTELTLEEAFPGRKPLTVKATVDDGAGYNPLFFIDAQRSLGAAATDGGLMIRLILRTPEGERELRRLAETQKPEFTGFAVQEQRVAWLEMTTTPEGTADTRLWALDSLAATPRLVTADTGDVALFDRRDDVVIHDDKISWMAAADTETPHVEIRTVAFDGGPVTVDTREGLFAIAVWPWLTSVSIGQDGPIELTNLDSLERIVVGAQPNELMACSPTWCRALIIGGGSEGTTVIEMLKPDGSLRLRTATGDVNAATVDVGLLDRFEIYSYSPGKLVAFDLEDRRSITLAKGISQVGSRGPVLWWSTGDNETTVWHVLDLRTLIEP